MRPIHTFKTALLTGAMLGLFHAFWASLVALGWGQAVLDFVLRLHMIHMDFTVGPFAPVTAAALVAFTTGVGFVFGLIFALIWNRFASAEG